MTTERSIGPHECSLPPPRCRPGISPAPAPLVLLLGDSVWYVVAEAVMIGGGDDRDVRDVNDATERRDREQRRDTHAQSTDRSQT